MAANVEHQALCKIIETGDFHTVEKFKIDDSYFLGDQTQFKEVFRYLHICYHHPNTKGSIPSWDLMKNYFPGFPWVGSHDSLPILLTELRKSKLRAQIVGMADELLMKVDTDPLAALDTIRDAATRLHIEHERTNDSLMSESYDKLRSDYDLVRAGNGMLGIPYPWQWLNDDTQGIHKEDFIIVFGRPKSMKSWIAFLAGVEAYYYHRQRVLIWSMEMSKDQCLRRCACLITKVDYDKFKNAKLDPTSEAQVFQVLAQLREQENHYKNPKTGREPALLVTSPHDDHNEAGIGVSALQAKIREFEPDLVVVDGMYLMRDDRDKKRSIDWKNIAHISQDLKGTTKSFKVPIIGTTQANRSAKSPNDKEADLSELAYADALAQDCDMAIRVSKQKDKDGSTELVMSIPGSREGKLDGFVIHGYPASNFSQKRLNIRDADDPANQPAKDKKATSLTHQVPSMPNWRGST